MVIAGARVGFVDEALGYYRVRSDSLSASPLLWGAHLTVLERHLPALWAQGARGRARDCFEIGERLAARGERRQAARFFLHAVRGDDAGAGARLRFAALGAWRLARPGPVEPDGAPRTEHYPARR
jgi:hypothetical protein